MRIAQLANFVGPSSGGIKTAINALGAGYAASGADRLLVMPGASDSRTATPHGEIVTLRGLPVGGGYRVIVEPWRVIDVLEGFGPTSVEISDKATMLPVTSWARRNGVGSVLFSHERLDAMLSLLTGWDTGVSTSVSVFYRLLVRRFDSIVVTSEFAESEFSPLTATVNTPLRRVPLGVDLEVFHPSRAAARPEGPLRLVHAGRMSREKSPHLAVATAVALHRRGVPVELDVYGAGPHLGEVKQIAGDARVTFHGHEADRYALAAGLARADIALSVCPGETFGLAVLEALAAGTPVVTADVGGARELVTAASGAWARPHAELLADAVLQLAGRPVDERRRAARLRAEQFPWRSAVDSMLNIHSEWAPAWRRRLDAATA